MSLCENTSMTNEFQDIFTVFTMESRSMSFENNGNRLESGFPFKKHQFIVLHGNGGGANQKS